MKHEWHYIPWYGPVDGKITNGGGQFGITNGGAGLIITTATAKNAEDKSS